MKILISRPDKIGDVVLALHGIKQLKKLLPESFIAIYVSEYTKSLVENIKFIDQIIISDGEVLNGKFDAVVDLIAKKSTSKLFSEAKIPLRIGNSARWFSYRYTKTRMIRRSKAELNEAEYNWQLMTLLSKKLAHTNLYERLSFDDFKNIPEQKNIHTKKYIALMPGVSVSAYGWAMENWVELVKIIASNTDYEIGLIVGPAEKHLKDQINEKIKNFSAATCLSFEKLEDVLFYLKSASFYVGPSTGITHLASALNIAGVALYPEKKSMHPNRWFPFMSKMKLALLSKNPKAQAVFDLMMGKSVPSIELAQEKISAFVICKNEERNIERCLKSLAWCDDLVVVDSGSSDKTVEIAKKYTEKVIFNEWIGHKEQKQFALNLCENDWVVHLDSDEELSMELKSSLKLILQTKTNVSGYFCKRVVYYLDRWWNNAGWRNEYRMRFFKKSHTIWGGSNPHDKAIVSGRTKKLSSWIHHFTYRDFKHQIECLNNHSSSAANAMSLAGKKCSLFQIFFNPSIRFIKFYFFKFGFIQGLAGLYVAICEAYYTAMKYAKLWELNRIKNSKESK